MQKEFLDKMAQSNETKCFDKNEKPKLSLREFEVYDTSSGNVAGHLHGDSEKFDIKKLGTKLKFQVVSLNKLDMEFDMVGYDAAIANALRRILLSDVPTMAIEKIHMYQVSYFLSYHVSAA